MITATIITSIKMVAMANGSRTLAACDVEKGVVAVPMRSPGPNDIQWKTVKNSTTTTPPKIFEYILFSNRITSSSNPQAANITPTVQRIHFGAWPSGGAKQIAVPASRKITPINTGGLLAVKLPAGFTGADNDADAPDICA